MRASKLFFIACVNALAEWWACVLAQSRMDEGNPNKPRNKSWDIIDLSMNKRAQGYIFSLYITHFKLYLKFNIIYLLAYAEFKSVYKRR